MKKKYEEEEKMQVIFCLSKEITKVEGTKDGQVLVCEQQGG